MTAHSHSERPLHNFGDALKCLRVQHAGGDRVNRFHWKRDRTAAREGLDRMAHQVALVRRATPIEELGHGPKPEWKGENRTLGISEVAAKAKQPETLPP